ncbi:MAG: SpoIIE family protein phosphatase [Planctomycetota bacterium]
MPRNPPHIGPNQWLLTLGVFLIFGQIGIFIGVLQPDPPGWLFTLALWSLSGLIAMGWSWTINRSGWWLLLIGPLVMAPIFGFPLVFDLLFDQGVLAIGYDWPPIARQVFSVVWGAVSMSLGFSAVIYYITHAERVAATARAELEAARLIHEQLAPPIQFQREGLEVLGRSHASAEMGGDLVDLIDHGHAGSIDVLLGDVSGHGIRAGAVMALAKGALRTRVEGAPPVGEALSDVNRQLERLTDSAMFLTLTLARIDAPATDDDSRSVTLGLAGHHGALLIHSDGRHEQIGGAVAGLPLGVMPEERYETYRFTLAPGALLMLYTDGLSEVGAGQSGGMLGDDGVARLAIHAARDGATLDEVHDRVMSGVRDAGEHDDDQSMVLLRLVPGERAPAR